MTGIQDQVGALRRVYVRAPQAEDHLAWRAYGWHAPPHPSRAAEEHAAFRAELERAGSEVVSGLAPAPGDPDAIYVYDPVLATTSGALLLRPGKEGRRSEPDVVAQDLRRAGMEIRGRIEPPGTIEGGDLLWLDEGTLAVGRSYRTDERGVRALRSALPDVEVLAFDLPHRRGPGSVLHLLSLISLLDRDLAVAYPPLVPVRLMQELARRGITLVEVPEAELESMGPNVLALAPRVALALEGNPETRRRMEASGVEVRTYRGDEISRKGDGGPTCLTRPLLRD
ncbi:MAG TPA: arginine deiminase family protein [Actinomycetota bacterium]|nr:arginine deiminase family protein [Actinomycetota bacterium]